VIDLLVRRGGGSVRDVCRGEEEVLDQLLTTFKSKAAYLDSYIDSLTPYLASNKRKQSRGQHRGEDFTGNQSIMLGASSLAARRGKGKMVSTILLLVTMNVKTDTASNSSDHRNECVHRPSIQRTLAAELILV
jgi:hypothetical protein